MSAQLPEGAYRCSVCGHGNRLYACALAVVAGALLPDGSVTESDVTQTALCEDSIDCQDHPLPGHRLERWIGGQWTYWEPCPWVGERGLHCAGGFVEYRGRPTFDLCPACKGQGGSDVLVADSASMPVVSL